MLTSNDITPLFRRKEKWIVAGIMSGTSLDGLDIAICSFTSGGNGLQFEILQTASFEYSRDWKEKLENAVNISGLELILLDKLYGKYIGECILKTIQKEYYHLDLISSHGHTVFHDPSQNLNFQLGNGAVIHAHTGIPVINDFRTLDVALNGQGAPLVPAGDIMLFPEYDLWLNLGGIANITLMNRKEEVKAFDICPCNILLNHVASKNGSGYDKGGAMAARGKTLDYLEKQLCEYSYYNRPFPKSLDKSNIQEELFPLIDNCSESVEDIMSTVSWHIAGKIGKVIGGTDRGNTPRVLVTGGGAFNGELVRRIGEISGAEIVKPSDEVVEFKEALVFAFLGLLRAEGIRNTFASVTGAKESSTGGAIWGRINNN